MAITLRTNKGSALTYDEMDKNFSQYFYSASRSGNIMTLYYTGSTNLSGYDPSRVITVDLNPAEGTTPNLVAGGSERSIQYKAGSQLAGQPTFVYSANNYLGIGTANPGVLVEAVGTTVSPAILALTSHPTNSTTAYVTFNRGSAEVGAIGKIDGVTDNILLLSSQANSMVTIKAGTNPTGIITVNGQTANIGVGTSYPGAKLETAINGASGKTLIFGRGWDANFNLAGKQDKTDLGNAVDGAVVGSIGLDYINQENTAIRFHRGATVTGGYMSFTVKDGSTRMQLANTGTLTIFPEVNNALALNAEGNTPGQNIYLQVKNQGTTPYSQAVFSAATNTNDPIQFGSTYLGTGFIYNGNPGRDLEFSTKPAGVAINASSNRSLLITSDGKVGIFTEGVPEGRLHVNQVTTLGSAANSYTLLKTVQQFGGSNSAGSRVFIRDWSRRRDASTNDWLTWKHHNGIDIDGAHSVPGSTTLTFWERSPFTRTQTFGSETTTTLTLNSGAHKVTIGQADEDKHPNATLSVLHPNGPSIVNVGHTTTPGPHKVVISGGGTNVDYGYYLSGSTTTDVFFKTNTGTPSIGQLGSNGTTVATVDGPNNVFTITGKLAATPAAKPANMTAAGIPGEIRIDPTAITGVYYMYVCIASGNWKRVALSNF